MKEQFNQLKLFLMNLALCFLQTKPYILLVW